MLCHAQSRLQQGQSRSRSGERGRLHPCPMAQGTSCAELSPAAQPSPGAGGMRPRFLPWPCRRDEEHGSCFPGRAERASGGQRGRRQLRDKAGIREPLPEQELEE